MEEKIVEDRTGRKFIVERIGDQAEIWSYPYTDTLDRFHESRKLNYTIGNHGYFRVWSGRQNGHGTHELVHRLIAIAFVYGRDEENNFVDHVDCNKLNNLISNLQWVSTEENTKRAYKNGLINVTGENHPMSKLTDVQRLEIVKLKLEDNLTYREIGEIYGLHAPTIWKVVNKWYKKQKLGND